MEDIPGLFKSLTEKSSKETNLTESTSKNYYQSLPIFIKYAVKAIYIN